MNISRFLPPPLLMAMLGFALLSVNFYGVFQDIRKDGLGTEAPNMLRFPNDIPLPFEQSLQSIAQLNEINSETALVEAATSLVNDSLSHVEWLKVDSKKYNQLIPVWENYFIFLLGKFSGLPFYERYHFADYKRSLERGIGVCGDASMVLSQILNENSIENQIISFEDHVIVRATLQDGTTMLADPDFGVILHTSLSELSSNKKMVVNAYIEKGYNEKESIGLFNVYATPYSVWDDTYHFISKRYIFEYASYILKWLLPILLLLYAIAPRPTLVVPKEESGLPTMG